MRSEKLVARTDLRSDPMCLLLERCDASIPGSETMRMISKCSPFAMAIVAASVSACGGQSQSPPPETPPPPSESAPEPSTTEGADTVPEGEHTMPDGTTMPGHDHGDGTEE
jgi:hypothetical protein